MEFDAKVRTCLGFNGNGHEAANFYVSSLPDSRIENMVHPDPDGPPLVIELTRTDLLLQASFLRRNALKYPGRRVVPILRSVKYFVADESSTHSPYAIHNFLTNYWKKKSNSVIIQQLDKG